MNLIINNFMKALLLTFIVGPVIVFMLSLSGWSNQLHSKSLNRVHRPFSMHPAQSESAQPRILLFSKTAGFRHGSIPNAIAVIESLGVEHGFLVDQTEESAFFTDENLALYDAVIWVMTTGDVLNDSEQAAFEQYIRSGGGYAGIHSASDTEFDWPWYGDLMGAFFQDHPKIQTATIQVEDGEHTSTAHLGATWIRNDEWYNYRTNPRATTNILLALDESTYNGGKMGDHPIAWYHEFDGGRAWYTGGGHTVESYSEPDFVQHLLGGIQYAAGIGGDSTSPTATSTPIPTSTSTELPPSITPVSSTATITATSVLTATEMPMGTSTSLPTPETPSFTPSFTPNSMTSTPLPSTAISSTPIPPTPIASSSATPFMTPPPTVQGTPTSTPMPTVSSEPLPLPCFQELEGGTNTPLTGRCSFLPLVW